MTSRSPKKLPDLHRVLLVTIHTALLIACGFGMTSLCAIIMPSVVMAKDGLSTQSEKLDEFSNVEIQVPSNVRIKQAEKSSVSITAEPQVLDKLRVQVSGETLCISSTGSFTTKQPVIIEIGVRQLSQLKTGAASIVTIDGLKEKHLVVVVSAATELSLKRLNLELVKVFLMGSGSVVSSGRSAEQQILIGGSGSYDAKELQSDRATIEISGAGDASFSELRHLSAKISGAGAVRYRGSPQLKKEIIGAGIVEQL